MTKDKKVEVQITLKRNSKLWVFSTTTIYKTL